MLKPDVIQAIHRILANTLAIPRIQAFADDARLNEDLYLDSVLVLQLLLNLEIECGFEMPDTALTKEDFDTVDSLATFVLQQTQVSEPSASAPTQEQAPSSVDTELPKEEFEDIKVHCFVSCLCEIIKADPRTDHRPFYFGVWDAEVVIDDNACLGYHSASINHDFFRTWFERLYNVPVRPWYRPECSKMANTKQLLTLLDDKTDTENIMVMLDMFRLPERENKFNRDPFPHYVMLELTDDPDIWMMYDPDFRWEGTQKKTDVLHAIASDAVSGGYRFDSVDIRPTTNEAIRAYFTACINATYNPMTDAVSHILEQHLNTDTHYRLANLDTALEQLPVLAIRKYAYEHGLAFFWRELSLEDAEFEQWCDVIEALVSTYKQIQFRAMKLAKQAAESNTVDSLLVEQIRQLIDEQNIREFSIKNRLVDVFNVWTKQTDIPVPVVHFNNDSITETV
ncbi:Acyl carrier protein [BD1-7 clade bacterium]|nr:Acyl carrier protein [BD1-7 clade bacterium]